MGSLAMRKLALMLGLLWLSGCSAPPPKVSLFATPAAVRAKDYGDILAKWTRGDRIYRGFDTQLFVTATMHTAELRLAFAEAFPEIYGHGGMVTRRELVDLTGDVEQFHNFFVAAYTPDDKWNDLAEPDSVWRLRLRGSGGIVVDPAAIETVKLDANLCQVYPYLGRFDKAYIVRFPLTDEQQRLVLDERSTSATLRVASALGGAELVWDLLPIKAPE